MGLLNNLSPDDDSVNNDDQGTIIHLDLWLGVTYMNNAKKEKEINKELILVAWHSTKC